jgi:uroporphyrin-III C-methyltransferase
VLPESAADAVRLLGRARDAIRAQHPADFSARFEAMQRITSDEALDAVEDGDLEALAAVIASKADVPAPSTPPTPTVHIVGAGPGDPGLLTAAALRVLHRADVVFHDSLVSKEILRILPSRVETVPVGRRLGRVVRAQSEIHRGLIEQARAGRRVVRLKGGDPAVFGRVGEETEALAAAGIRVGIVPGVTAAVAAAASARVPLTWRGIAASAVFVSAYHADEADGDGNGNGASRSGGWENLEHLARHVDTLAVYMGASRGGDVARALLRAGRSPAEGVVVVEHASLPTEEVHWTTLADLAFARSPQRYRRPALILIGPAVAAAQRGETRAAAAAGSARAGFVPAPVPTAVLREGARA